MNNFNKINQDSLTADEKAVAKAMLKWHDVKARGLFAQTHDYGELEPLSQAMDHFVGVLNVVNRAGTPEESIKLYLDTYDEEYTDGSNSLAGTIIKFLWVDMRKVASYCLSETVARYEELTDDLLNKTREALNGK